MSPETEQKAQSDEQEQIADEEAEAEAEEDTTKSQKASSKRRTKTGCLTCRKRRIKCGEERPICKNCIKSKRECAGYNPPLVYRRGQEGQLSLPTYSTSFPNGYIQFPVNHPGYDGHQRVEPPYSHHTPYSQLNTVLPNSAVDRSHLYYVTNSGLQTGQALGPSQWPSSVPRQSMSADQVVPAPDAVLNQRSSSSASFSDPMTITIPIIPYTASLTPSPYSSVTSAVYSTSSNILQQSEVPTPSYSEHSFIDRPSYTRLAPDNAEHTYTTDMEEDPEDPFDVMDELQEPIFAADGTAQYLGLPKQQDLSFARNTSQNSPLLNDRSRQIFQHFLLVTGPNMSIFDRLEYLGPREPPMMVWTHGLPAMAFNHPALAHAILSVSAMQLARLGQGGQEAALKHFTLALRRVGKLLASDESRHQVSTLATVLLLAYYEVIAGDHSRWSLHLSGAARLIMEHNYAAIFRTIRRMRARAKANLSQPWLEKGTLSGYDYVRIADIPEALLHDNDWDVDENLVSKLMGITVDYNHQVQPNMHSEQDVPDLSKAEIGDVRILMEIYWWYIKQDIYQSMLSGDAPMLPYSKMRYCPPRGPIGKADHAHATMDHLWLLMARLMNFGAKDRTRKLQVVASQGGNWIPAPGFLPTPPMPPKSTAGAQPQGASMQAPHNETPPTANEGRARKVKPVPSGMPGMAQPPMYGMMPPPAGPVHMSTSFKAMNAELRKDDDSTSNRVDSDSIPNAELDLKKALAEHASIGKALDVFRAALGKDFEPLPGGEQLTTPFGPPLRYKSPTIATIWTFYHVCRILLRRLHPHSPPAAMISAGVNAYVTREHAQTVGKIVGGLYAQHNILVDASQVDHMFTAALMETTFPLLFAAVQYQDPAQRGWTITKLADIAQSTGWPSSSAVAAACETTWTRMGMAGKGPPYERTLDRRNADARVSGRNRTAQSTVDGISQMDALAEHESRFVSHDRELIVRHGSTRAYWALGLLSVEEDLEKMQLGKKDDRRKEKE